MRVLCSWLLVPFHFGRALRTWVTLFLWPWDWKIWENLEIIRVVCGRGNSAGLFKCQTN